MGNHFHSIHKFSQSTHNLTEAVKPTGGPSNGGRYRGRSRSRLRLLGQRSADMNDTGSSSIVPVQQYQIFGRLPQEVWSDCRVPLSIMVCSHFQFNWQTVLKVLCRNCNNATMEYYAKPRCKLRFENLSVNKHEGNKIWFQIEDIHWLLYVTCLSTFKY